MDPNRDIKYSTLKVSDTVQFGGIMTKDECKALAKKIMSIYDGDGNGTLDSFEVGYIQSDCYRAMNKGFNPTPTDIAAFSRIIDRRQCGMVTDRDIEALCIKYFGGNFDRSERSERVVAEQNISQQRTYETSSFNKQVSSNQNSKVITVQQQTTITNQVSSIPSSPPVKNTYSQVVQERLEVARRIFRMLDTEKNGFITEKHVPQLLQETYKLMGMSIEPTQEDVELWMEMADEDRDGKVFLKDYEALVIRSLKQQGIVLE
ncbi:unnamed protein product [Paramecium pentaurelia]|uniref:EF-hand domain-containing protein n=1 Tax=Paramecium pentaurelia TaxID=43138 RepID=A0A8S1SE79_9CILI|nr:unnamed protein product [Paramecium pentaurelia]